MQAIRCCDLGAMARSGLEEKGECQPECGFQLLRSARSVLVLFAPGAAICLLPGGKLDESSAS
jgi:hypothetical protein